MTTNNQAAAPNEYELRISRLTELSISSGTQSIDIVASMGREGRSR